MAWKLRQPDPDKFRAELEHLERVGILAKTETGWVVAKFATRQAPISAADRMKAYRERLRDETLSSSGNDEPEPEAPPDTPDETELSEGVDGSHYDQVTRTVTTGNRDHVDTESIKKKEPPKRQKRQASPPSEAVNIYRSVFKLYPNKTTWEQISDAVGDRTDLWRQVCAAWNLQQYNPRNLTGLVDWLNQGIPDYAKAGGKPHPAYQNGASPQPSRASPPSINDSDIILTDAQRKAIETAKQFQEDR
jgi:hypothetical protein